MKGLFLAFWLLAGHMAFAGTNSKIIELERHNPKVSQKALPESSEPILVYKGKIYRFEAVSSEEKRLKKTGEVPKPKPVSGAGNTMF